MKKENGITLIALVITIVVLLILAGISVSVLSGDNGIINQAKKGKEETEISEEKEILTNSLAQAAEKDVYGDITKENLQDVLNKEVGIDKTEVSDLGKELEVLFKNSNRYYTIDKDGKISDVKEIISDKTPGDITKDKNGNELDGSEEHPFEIWCIEDLLAFSNMVNGNGKKFVNGVAVDIISEEYFSQKYIALKIDLDFKSRFSYINSERTDFGDINGNDSDGNQLIIEMTTGTGFAPIGYKSWNFNGTFNGEGHKIKNLYEKNKSDSDVLGLFGMIKDSTIKNLTVTGNINTEGDLTERYTSAGGIVGYGSGKIINCVSDVNINISGYGAAGILGREMRNAEIVNCINLATITNTTESTAGIVGRSEANIKIYNCYNLGDIISTGYQVGGILGFVYNEATVINVYNAGNIPLNGADGRSGIIGSLGWASISGTIKNAYNVGTIVDKKVNWTYGAGSMCGYFYNDNTQLTIENGYYLKNTCSRAVGNKEDSLYGVTQIESIEENSVKELFNSYIEENSDGIDTSEWKKWNFNKDGEPTF